ncbi:MAG: protoporphyrinogen oxidase [Sphingomonadales bacterium]
MSDTDVAVIGGGISGLATAWRLARAGLSVEVWERDDRPGGKIRTHASGGYVTEQAASMVLNFLPQVARLLSEAGLDSQMTPCRPQRNRYVVADGRLQPVPMKLGALMRSPIWSTKGKLRLLAEPFIPRTGHDRATVTEFISRRLGREFLDKTMEPFVGGTLASDPDRANAVSVLPRLTSLERRYGSFTAGLMARKISRKRVRLPDQILSFAGGMSALIDTLSQTPGVRIRTGHEVQQISRRRHLWRIQGQSSDGDRSILARNLVLSVPADIAASLIAPLDRELAGVLAEIEYAPMAVVHLGVPRSAVAHPLDGNGFLTPRREGLAVNGCLWMTSLFPDRAPEGKALLTCYLGGSRRPEAMDWDDERLAREAIESVGGLLGIAGEAETARIDRHARALPLYYGAYQERLRMITTGLTRHQGLFLEANYRGGISVRDRLARAHAVAEEIIENLEAPRRIAI